MTNNSANTYNKMLPPLPERMRPRNLDEYVGQKHLVGKGCVLRNMIEGGNLTSFILWGPPGVGKTSLARIVANSMDRDFYTLSAVSSGVKDVREVIDRARSSATSMFGAGKGAPILFIDEIHKYEKWSIEIKEIYDLYPQLHVVLSGSSLLALKSGLADLSRRMLQYDMPGLSFREYLRFDKRLDFQAVSLDNLLNNPAELCFEVRERCSPLEYFSAYIQKGYYPFYFEDYFAYAPRVENVVNYTIDNELTSQCGVDVANTRKIKALMQVISGMIPFEVDTAKISRNLGLQRLTLLQYMKHLEDAKLIRRLFANLLTTRDLQKPDKILLDNPNLLYVLCPTIPATGTVRETFFCNQLASSGHVIEYGGMKNADFKIDGNYVIEVGGRDKGYSQLDNTENGYVAADGIDSPVFRKIPLWAFGFLY